MKTHRRGRILGSVAAISVAGIALAGCTGGPGTGGNGGGDGGGGGGEDDNVVTIYGTISGTEAELLEESWAEWEEENGIDIEYEASQEFEAQIAVRAQGGSAPDLAIFPQPGLLADMATRGFLVEAPEAVKANAEEYWTDLWQGFGTVDDTFYGAPLMASVKGWIWYSPATFEENGWEIPTTWQGLKDLTAQIAEETDGPPWCVGFGSDAATGWPGTDWIEDVVLRQSGTDVYDQWVANEIPFTDPQIKSAFDEVGSIILNPEYVNAGYGDVQSIGTTPFGDPATALASGDCLLHHQASFYDGFIVDAGATVAEDGDIWAFITPPFEESDGGAATVTGGGEIVGAFDDSESTQAVQEYLSSPEWANSRVSLGGVISANKGLDPANASSAILSEAIELLQDDATTFRFDGSDLMPSSVGAGTFWQGMRDWVNGTDTDTVLEQIESGWPSS
ncbi:ABC transporter substrate-binding protein [Microbacterium sp. ARD31]|jgi:alpha-glucoside transport system substrate-binding protein|uniref:ABC transporter substrate-binding protein n=1 Tax=Microbacterium sp. ARD31 TaxID=2962576 RepID=UPI002881E240|nr:ABC transporter substrate-binding protein [Microbacterium sp. ARD31]MDT0180432.1 ABC transporter substrate-binding protein [Microbacterium sp. ARD31]